MNEDATHMCVVCGAQWRLNQPLCTRDTGLKPGYPLHRASWTCVTPQPWRVFGDHLGGQPSPCGPCCDNEPMDGPNIVTLPISGIND